MRSPADAASGVVDVMAMDEVSRLRFLYDELGHLHWELRLQQRLGMREAPIRSWIGRVMGLLPYDVRMRLLLHLVRRPLAQQKFWRSQVALIRRFHAVLDTRISVSEMIAQSLFFNLQGRYGENTIGRDAEISERVLARRTSVCGRENMARASHDRGVILAVMHTVSNAVWFPRLRLHDYFVGSLTHVLERCALSDADVEAALMARQMQVAIDCLTKKLAVGFAPDGFRGRAVGIGRRFHGRRRVFRTGFAEAATMAEAPVMMVLEETQPCARVNWRVLAEPLDIGGAGMSHAARVEHLMDQYLVHLDALWCDTPWLIPWQQMHNHLALPA